MNYRSLWFLLASFISALGDFILVGTLPNGLGVESGRVDLAVLAWLLPAIAVFFATFMGTRLNRRAHTARKDYSKLLFGIFVIEVLISLLAMKFRGSLETIILISVFLLLYAFIKEGLPRLFYQVAVYRYFVEESQYAKLAGFKAGLDISAALIGTVVASQFVKTGNWRVALLLDATTFAILAGVLWYHGKDLNLSNNVEESKSSCDSSMIDWRSLRWILFAVPLFHAVSALYVNYLPLIHEKVGILGVSESLMLFALLRLPGAFMGLRFSRLAYFIPASIWVRVLPVAYVVASLIFLQFPMKATSMLIMMLGGVNTGVFLPADIMIRSKLPNNILIQFSVIVLRWLAIFQFLACLVALYLYRSGTVSFLSIGGFILLFAVCSVMIVRYHETTFSIGQSSSVEADDSSSLGSLYKS